jgi:SagB-type dehydrogenase family enzyme
MSFIPPPLGGEVNPGMLGTIMGTVSLRNAARLLAQAALTLLAFAPGVPASGKEIAMNDPAPAARRYRELTKHTPESVARSTHRLVWANKPTLYREYAGAETVPLPPPRPLTRPVLEVLTGAGAPVESAAALDFPLLTSLLFASGGITGTRPDRRGDIRATAAAGALYPNETYVVSGAVEGLPPGLYHYDPKRERLTRLRDGDWRASLAEAAVDERVRTAPASLVLTGILWRSAWKYRERGYRHLYWDGGMKLAHVLAAAGAASLPAHALTAFLDRDVDRLLGVDGRSESALAIVPLGEPGKEAEPGPIPFAATPLSPQPIDHPEALGYHAASMLDEKSQVLAFRTATVAAPEKPPEKPNRLIALPEPAASAAPFDEVVRRRRSTRQFARRPIRAGELSAILSLPPHGAARLETFVIVHAVEGIPAGAYRYDPAARALETLKSGDLRQAAGFLALRQSLAADASAVVFYLADLNALFAAFGERGYRVAELEAGLTAGRAYLVTYALRRGATGLTFFDDEVTRFFSPRAAGLEPLLVVAVGVPARRAN